MSVMNFQSSFRDVKPPEKGSFPLDHEAECKQFMVSYMRCLRENAHKNTECRLLARDYLQCRMDKNLMAKEDWGKLGFNDVPESSAQTTTTDK
jgi:cytochrome c oxidase assembly protein subunit 19